MRTFGAKDLKKRKTRSDKKNKQRKKNGKFQPYVSKRQRGDPYKVWFWELKPMTIEGYRNWNKNARPHICRTTKNFVGKPILVEPDRLSNKEAVGQLAIDVLGYDGDFNLMMPSHRKNKKHVSYCKKAQVKIFDSEEGLRASVPESWKLSRYWFWSGK